MKGDLCTVCKSPKKLFGKLCVELDDERLVKRNLIIEIGSARYILSGLSSSSLG